MNVHNSLLGLRSMLAGMLGVRFGGNRNYYQTFGYESRITYAMALAKYVRQDVAGRIVDMPAEAIWDHPPAVTSNSPEWDRAFDNIVVQQSLWQQLNRLDKLAGLDLYSALVIGVEGEALTSPAGSSVVRRGRPRADANDLRRIIYLQPYSMESAQVGDWDEDSTSPNFRKPLNYKLRSITESIQQVKASPAYDKPVHYSRVLHVADGTLENDVYGVPRLHRVFNLLDDLLKVVGGSAETFWITANRGLQIDVDKEMELSPEDASDLSDEVDEFIHGMKRVIRTRGVKATALGSATPSPEANFRTLTSLISASSGIPQRILFGSEAGQLASEQDRANWAERVSERRQHFAEPCVLFPFIRKATDLGVLPAPENLQITVQWPDPFHMSPLERAQTAAQHARSATNFAKALTAELPGDPIETTDPETGITTVAPGPGKPLGLLTVDEARAFMELALPNPTFNEISDVRPPEDGEAE